MSKELTQQNKISIFSTIEAFENGQRIAKALSSADLVPQSYKNNVLNTMIALEMANRIGVSPFMVMQNLDVIKGKPSWSSTFIISALNSCGRFKPLRFKFEGKDPNSDEYGCRATAIDAETGEDLVGPKVDWKMVKAEGWLSKPGSKWKTMPELMFHYRSASFFGRLYAPDILKGMHTVEEQIDISGIKENLSEQKHKELKSYYEENDFDLKDDDRLHIERIIELKEEISYDKVKSVLESKIILDGNK